MTFSSFHTHSTFCDGKNTPEELVLEAIRQGSLEIGFSSHAHMILRLKDKYSDRIKIFLGIEYDYFSDTDISDYDYIIGSAHYILKNGYYIPLDESAEHHKKAIKELYNGDSDALAEEHYSMLSGIFEKTNCNIIGHFDIITKYNERELIYEETPRYKEAALTACKTLSEKPVVFEINTGAIGRGYRTSPYPAPFILDGIISHKSPVIITSDAHSKEFLFEGMKEIANELDKKSYSYFTTIEEVLNFCRKK